VRLPLEKKKHFTNWFTLDSSGVNNQYESAQTCDVVLEVLHHGVPIGARVVQLGFLATIVFWEHVSVQMLVQRRHLVTVEEQLKTARENKRLDF